MAKHNFETQKATIQIQTVVPIAFLYRPVMISSSTLATTRFDPAIEILRTQPYSNTGVTLKNPQSKAASSPLGLVSPDYPRFPFEMADDAKDMAPTRKWFFWKEFTILAISITWGGELLPIRQFLCSHVGDPSDWVHPAFSQ